MIRKLIERLNYIEKSDLKIRKRIDDRYVTELFEYTHNSSNVLMKQFKKAINDSVLNYINKKKTLLGNVEEQAKIFRVLKDIREHSENVNDFESYVKGISREILSETEIDKFVFNSKIVKFFTEFLPISNITTLSLRREWINVDLYHTINKFTDELTQLFEKEFSKFEIKVRNSISNHTNEYFKKSIDKAFSIEDVQSITTVLTSLTHNTVPIDFNIFINNFNASVLSDVEKKSLISEKSLMNLFIDELPIEKKKKFNSKIWLNYEFEFHVINLIKELKQYTQEDINYLQSSFIYKSHFGKMSSIITRINSYDSYLKSVKIYTTHSFIFDIDYKLSKEKYETHSPDLVIVSPKVKIEKEIIVDLSCDRIPDYPDGIKKAEKGSPGMDGKPGLPGYNGGNLLVSADEILNKNRLRFISEGGKGGPGQEGFSFIFTIK